MVKDTAGLMPGGLADRRPRAVRVAAGGTARGLRPAGNIAGLGIGPAVAAAVRIGRTRHHRTIAAAVRGAPGDRGAGGTALQRVHFRLVSEALVLVVERGADAVADQGADAGADQRARHVAAGVAAELRADRRAAQRAEQGAGVLFRARPHAIGASRTGAERGGKADGGNGFRKG